MKKFQDSSTSEKSSNILQLLRKSSKTLQLQRKVQKTLQFQKMFQETSNSRKFIKKLQLRRKFTETSASEEVQRNFCFTENSKKLQSTRLQLQKFNETSDSKCSTRLQLQSVQRDISFKVFIEASTSEKCSKTLPFQRKSSKKVPQSQCSNELHYKLQQCAVASLIQTHGSRSSSVLPLSAKQQTELLQPYEETNSGTARHASLTS